MQYLAVPHSYVLTEGGIKQSNLLRTLHGTTNSEGRALDGVAIVSEIMGSTDPKAASEGLRQILNDFERSPTSFLHPDSLTPEIIIDKVVDLMVKIRKMNPLVHQVHFFRG